MMGLANWLHWTAWFLKQFLFLLISVIIMTIFFCIPIGDHGSIIGFTSPTVLLVFLLAYAIASISFAFMVSVFFSKGKLQYGLDITNFIVKILSEAIKLLFITFIISDTL